MKVYFAHPCFNAEQEEFKALFLKRISGALSHRSDIHIIDPFGHTPNIEDDTEAKLKMAKDIKTGCIRLLEECDIVIALADGSDTGTAFEAGYAHARGKPVILISRMGCAAANAMLIGSAVMMIDDVLGEGRMEELAGYLERYDATTSEHLLSPESA